MTDSLRKNIIESITRMLARREHACNELIQKLTQKGFPLKNVSSAVREFTEANIQSDFRYAEMRFRAARNKGQGPLRVKQECRSLDIEEVTVERALQEADIDWYTLAKQVKDKKFGELPPIDFADKQKQMRFLQYRGFTSDQIQYAMEGS